MNDLKETLLRNKKPLLVILGVTAVVFWFLGNTFLNLVHNKLELKRLTKLSAQLDREYELQQARLELLQKQDPVYMEKLARVDYHMSAPGETEFRFHAK